MEQTLASMVCEVELLVKPLGFKIETVRRVEKSDPLLIGPDTRTGTDDGGLTITITRKGSLD
jgi:hypothetical protein